jgi:hypothetical protein
MGASRQPTILSARPACRKIFKQSWIKMRGQKPFLSRSISKTGTPFFSGFKLRKGPKHALSAFNNLSVCWKRMKSYTHSWFLLVILTILASCAPTRAKTEPTPPVSSNTLAICQPSKIQISKDGLTEIQGTMSSDGELWALLFFNMAQTGRELKIVWRITGSGEYFSVQARHEDGTTISPSWGPEYHGGSSWQRPGQEWGIGFNFPKPGCWTLTVTRGSTTGEIRLDIIVP